MSCPHCRSAKNPAPGNLSQKSGAPTGNRSNQAPAQSARTLHSTNQAPASDACQAGPPSSNGDRHSAGHASRNNAQQALRSFFRRIADKISWLLPGIGLILMPKCPLCLAAYISAATGLTIPFAATALFRDTLIIICVAALAWLLARTFVKLIQ